MVAQTGPSRVPQAAGSNYTNPDSYASTTACTPRFRRPSLARIRVTSAVRSVGRETEL